jgi:hypothetical protein
MSVTAAPSASFEAVAAGFATGLVGTIGVRLIDNAGNTTTARATAGITEYPAGSGIYAKTMTAPAVAGQYTLVWDNGATTPGNVATEDLVVTSTTSYTAPSGTDYISSSDLKTTLGITVATYDTDIATAVAAASRGIDGATNRRFWADTGTANVRYYQGSETSRTLTIDDLVSVTELATDTSGDNTFADVLVNNTDFTLEPLNAAAENPARPYTLVRLHVGSSAYWPIYPRSVRITGKFGWPAVPSEIVRATTILATKLFKRQESPFGIVTAGVDDITAMRIATGAPTGNRASAGKSNSSP